MDGVCSVETASLQEEVEIRVDFKFPRDEDVESRRKAGDKLERKREAPEAAMDGQLILHRTEHSALSWHSALSYLYMHIDYFSVGALKAL